MNKRIPMVCLLLALCPAACVRRSLVRPGVVASGERVAAQFIENEVYLPVTVAGKTRLWILDTGAGASVIDRGFAQELGLEESGEGEGMGAAGPVKFAYVTVPRLCVGGIELDSQQVLGLEVTDLLRRNIGTEPAGILGYDFLSRFVTKVDFAREEVTFFRPEDFVYNGAGRTIPMQVENNIPVVEMQVDREYRGQWRLDIGAAVAVFHHHAVQEFDLAARNGVERLAVGVGGMERHRLVRFAAAELAGFTVEGPILSVPLEGGGGALAATDFVGTLGNSILRNFTLFLDYRNHRAIFERGGNFGKEPVLDRSGLQVARAESDSIVVVCAAPNTPAEKAGFKAGDFIEAVDGQSPETLGGLRRLRELFRGAPGTRCRFAVRRGDARLSLELKLEDLL